MSLFSLSTQTIKQQVTGRPGLLIAFVLSLAFASLNVHAQDVKPAPGNTEQAQKKALPPEELRQKEQEQFARSITYMLKRAKLTREMAAQHMTYIAENAGLPEAVKIEDASQIVAFDLVCADDTLNADYLDQIATEASYRIAVLSSRSPISFTLQDLAKEQSIPQRMELLGDVTSTTFMFMVGRRRGLFDSLITDFGREKFCDGMRPNMRSIYQALTTPETSEAAPDKEAAPTTPEKE